MRLGNRHLAAKILAMQDAANRPETQVLMIKEISSTIKLNDLNKSTIEESTITKTEEKLTLQCNREKKNLTRTQRGRVTTQVQEVDEDIPSTSKRQQVQDKVESSEIPRSVSDNIYLEVRASTPQSGANILQAAATENNGEVIVEEKRVVKDREKNKSGHARTHAIVINLDDRSRISEEVTV